MAKIGKYIRMSKVTERQLKWLTRQSQKSEAEVISNALDYLLKSRQTRAWSIISQMTDQELDEQIRQLALPDGDEPVEDPDTQYS